MTTQYIDNDKFYEAIKQFKKEKLVTPDMIIPEYLGECFMDISQNLSKLHNFTNYIFKQDMILDGIENCITALNTFNPEKSTNPFAYFTQVVTFAFIRRITKEKQQLCVKYKMMLEHDTIEEHSTGHVDLVQAGILQADQRAKMLDYVFAFEESRNKKKKKKNITTKKGILNVLTTTLYTP